MMKLLLLLGFLASVLVANIAVWFDEWDQGAYFMALATLLYLVSDNE